MHGLKVSPDFRIAFSEVTDPDVAPQAKKATKAKRLSGRLPWMFEPADRDNTPARWLQPHSSLAEMMRSIGEPDDFVPAVPGLPRVEIVARLLGTQFHAPSFRGRTVRDKDRSTEQKPVYMMPGASKWFRSVYRPETSQEGDQLYWASSWHNLGDHYPSYRNVAWWGWRRDRDALLAGAYSGSYEMALAPLGLTSWIVLHLDGTFEQCRKLDCGVPVPVLPPTYLDVQPETAKTARKLLDRLDQLEVESVVTGSPRGGLHVWIMLDQAVQVDEAQRVGQAVVRASGLEVGQVEVWPKPDLTDPTPIRLPGTKGSDLLDPITFKRTHVQLIQTNGKRDINLSAYHRNNKQLVVERIKRKEQFDTLVQLLTASYESGAYQKLLPLTLVEYPRAVTLRNETQLNQHELLDLANGLLDQAGRLDRILNDSLADHTVVSIGSSVFLAASVLAAPSLKAAALLTQDPTQAAIWLAATARGEEPPEPPPVHDRDPSVPPKASRSFNTFKQAQDRNTRDYRNSKTFAQMDAFVSAGPPAPGSRYDWMKKSCLLAARFFETWQEIVEFVLDRWIRSNGGQSVTARENRNHVEFMRNELTYCAKWVVSTRTKQPRDYQNKLRNLAEVDPVTEGEIRARARELKLEQYVEAALRIAPMLLIGRSEPTGIHSYWWAYVGRGAEDRKKDPETGVAYYFATKDAVLRILNAGQIGGFRTGRYAQRYIAMPFGMVSVPVPQQDGTASRYSLTVLPTVEHQWGRTRTVWRAWYAVWGEGLKPIGIPIRRHFQMGYLGTGWRPLEAEQQAA